MDISELVGGLRSIAAHEIEQYRDRKLSALRIAFERLKALGACGTFAEFLAGVPDALISTYFGSDGADHHYTCLLAGLCFGANFDDVALLAIVNFVLQELTYQGRYLGRTWPEVFVQASGNSWIGEACLANVDRITSYSLVEKRSDTGRLKDYLSASALNHKPIEFVAAPELRDKIPMAPGRFVGCVGFFDFDGTTDAISRARELISFLADFLTPDTHYLFAGAVDDIEKLRDDLNLEDSAYFVHKAYCYTKSSASHFRAVLIIAGLSTPLALDQVSAVDSRIYSILDLKQILENRAVGVQGLESHPSELVTQAPPLFISSSAALSDRSTSVISDPLHLHHNALKIPGGIFINSRTPYNRTYIVASAQDQVLKHIHEPTLFASSPYAPIDGSSTVEVPRRLRAHVDGACMPLAFSPAVLDYHSHFLLQCFPRISVARRLGLKDCKFLVPAEIKKYQREMMLMSGVKEEEIILMDEKFDYVCDELYVPGINPAIMSPFYAEIYDELVNSLNLPAETPSRRIIISRATRSTWRNMVNFDAMCSLLQEHLHFELVWPDRLNIADEIKLFRSAAVVVGAEGAGLYNCIFMQPGTSVVCLADQDYVMYVIGAMAQYRHFDVSFIFGESFQATRDLSRRAGHADFMIDPHRVLECVRRILLDRQRVG